MQSFLGMVNYSRMLIENLSEIALPQTKLAKSLSIRNGMKIFNLLLTT
jgi:hypothetical protein